MTGKTIALAAAAIALDALGGELRFVDGRELPLEGRAFADTPTYYERLPSTVTTNVNETARALARNTAGMQFRFVTDSDVLVCRWTLNGPITVGDNLSGVGASGIDIYRQLPSGRWEYAATGRPQGVSNECRVAWNPGTPCTIYLPQYNGLSAFSLGIGEKASVRPCPRTGLCRPVVFYGTSITQGGCSSRPGLGWVNVLGREMDVSVVNLGFSGAGRMEFEMADHLAAVDASCYVLDCIANMNEASIRERLGAFVRKLRKAKPDAPIVVAERPQNSADADRRNVVTREEYDRLVRDGVPGLFYVKADGLLPQDREGTAEGGHPNDLGMVSIARTFAKTLRAALSGPVAATGGVVLKPGRTEVVVAPEAKPVVRFAADEATNFLSRVFGRAVPVVSAPSGNRTVSVILGESPWAAAAGVSVADRPQDTFTIRAEGDRIYIVGRDDPTFDIHENIRTAAGHGPLFYFRDCERATLFGVYDFLERYAGCRFYFPHELGEIVPRADRIVVADRERTVTPEFIIRDPYFGGDGGWFCEKDEKDRPRVKSREWLRLRMGTTEIPCCHGSQWFQYNKRFAKTRPDFFALKENGERWLDPKVFAANQFCWSNPDFQETLYQDVKAYLTGQPASSRSIDSWNVNCRGRFVDIMPDDSFSGCWCERCQKAYRRDAGGKKVRDYATELIWGVTARIARRLADEGIEGNVTQMAYLPYGRVPDFALPTNVHVMVAKTGPWSTVDPERLEQDNRVIRQWADKLGHKVWIWTYPNKFDGTAIPGVPSMGPRAWGAYFKSVAPWIMGSFAECDADSAFQNHLNYYVFSRVCWDIRVDVEAVIDEYHRLMFGPAAPEMKSFYDALETNWVYRITGRVVDTALGPVASPPSMKTLWTEIYSPAERARLDGLFTAARGKVAPDSPEARRLDLVKRELFDGLVAAAEKWERKAATVGSDVYDATLGEPLRMNRVSFKGADVKPSVRTDVRLVKTADAFIVEWDCEEPEMDQTLCVKRPDDDVDNWMENGVECWLDPSANGKDIYQFMLTEKGSLTDIKYVWVGKSGKPDFSWSSGAKRHVERTATGWKARLEIPLASLPWMKDTFRANFCRDRIRKAGAEYSFSSRYADGGYGDVENNGTIKMK